MNTAETAAAQAEPAPRRVMLLSLWVSSGAEWHARLVGPDAAVHDFTSPFELARFLAHPPKPELPPVPGSGLR
jgi:hypothetical protein